MADDSLKLTDNQKRLVQGWLEAQWKGPHQCPICQQINWGGSEHVVQPVTHMPVGTMNIGGGVSYPHILIICNTCGYTMAFNAVKMGLFPKKDALAESAPAPAKEAPNG